MEKYKSYIIDKLEEFANNLCGEIMEKENITHGDIDPEQVFHLAMIYENVADLLLEIVEQNKDNEGEN